MENAINLLGDYIDVISILIVIYLPLFFALITITLGDRLGLFFISVLNIFSMIVVQLACVFIFYQTNNACELWREWSQLNNLPILWIIALCSTCAYIFYLVSFNEYLDLTKYSVLTVATLHTCSAALLIQELGIISFFIYWQALCICTFGVAGFRELFFYQNDAWEGSRATPSLTAPL